LTGCLPASEPAAATGETRSDSSTPINTTTKKNVTIQSA
jgi:hypothetical protein